MQPYTMSALSALLHEVFSITSSTMKVGTRGEGPGHMARQICEQTNSPKNYYENTYKKI